MPPRSWTTVVHRSLIGRYDEEIGGQGSLMMIPMHDPRRGRVMLRGQLIDNGYTDRAIAQRVKGGQWVKIRRGAYSEAHTWNRLDAPNRHALVARAASAQAKTDVVVSHTSAIPFYGGPDWGIDLGEVHLTREDGKAGRREAGVQQHCGEIEPGDVVERDGLRVMSATRIALEVTTVVDLVPSLCVVSHLLHEKHTTAEQLVERYASMRHWPWTLRTDLVLRLADPRFESVGECRLYHLCFQHGLPMPEIQYEVRDGVRVIGRVDFAWPDLGLFVEFDGKVKYEKLLKAGQRASDVVVLEKKREDDIRRVTGWRCLRFVWADLERPERTAQLIRAALFPPARAA
jgi:hypothetical protein